MFAENSRLFGMEDSTEPVVGAGNRAEAARDPNELAKTAVHLIDVMLTLSELERRAKAR